MIISQDPIAIKIIDFGFAEKINRLKLESGQVSKQLKYSRERLVLFLLKSFGSYLILKKAIFLVLVSYIMRWCLDILHLSRRIIKVVC
jgi:hypothetical protein